MYTVECINLVQCYTCVSPSHQILSMKVILPSECPSTIHTGCYGSFNDHKVGLPEFETTDINKTSGYILFRRSSRQVNSGIWETSYFLGLNQNSQQYYERTIKQEKATNFVNIMKMVLLLHRCMQDYGSKTKTKTTKIERKIS